MASVYQLFSLYTSIIDERDIYQPHRSCVCVCVSYSECKVLGSVPGTDRCFNDFRQWQTKWPPYTNYFPYILQLSMRGIFTSLTGPMSVSVCHTESARYWVQFPVQTDVLMTFVSGRQNGLRIPIIFPIYFNYR